MGNFQPNSRQFNERKINRKQDGFGAGAFDDIPGSKIPANGVRYAENYRLFDDRAEPRGGTKKWSATTLPMLKTGLSFSKTGQIITKTAGTDFDADDAGRFIVNDDGRHELIVGFTDSDVVTVDPTTAHAASVAGAVRGPEEHWPHRERSKIVLHIDKRFFNSPMVDMAWTEFSRIGPYVPDENQAKAYVEFDTHALVGNNTRIFKLNFDENVYYPLNTREPTARITDVQKTPSLTYGYRITYSMSRLTGADINRDRQTSGTVIELMSGPVQPSSIDYKDYGEIWTVRPMGEASTTYGVLTGIAPNGAMDTIVLTEQISDGQFKISISSTQKNIECDFTGVTSWDQIAKIKQDALNDSFLNDDITCIWNGSVFIITANDESSTVTAAASGDGGTDISSIAGLAGGAVTNPDFTSSYTASTFTIPVDPDTGERQQHWNFYSIWRTLDIGKNGIDPQTGDGNQQELYVWEGDYPVAKAATMSQVGGVISSTTDVFTAADVGDTIIFQDGSVNIISGFTNAREVTADFPATITEQSASMGLGGIITASQTGTTVTAASGRIFLSSDVGKIIYWSNGSRSTISVFTNTTTVIVAESQEIVSQAGTIDPISRVLTLTARDSYNGTSSIIKQLRSRIAGFSLPNRLWTALPSGCNTIAFVNGFLLAAERDKKKFYYSQAPENLEYLTGYYNANSQVGLVQDKITHIIPFENNVAIACSHSMVGVPLNTFSQVKIDEIGEIVFVITGQYVIDEEVGCTDWGSIAKIGGKQAAMMLTSEPGCRMLSDSGSGRLSFSDNLATDRLQRRLDKLNGNSSSSYDRVNGYMVWSRNTTKLVSSEDLVWQFEYDEDEEYQMEYVDMDIINFVYSV